MSMSDQWDQAAALFDRAPFQSGGWSAALEALTAIAGGWGGQMVAQSGAAIRFNQIVNTPIEALERYVECGGADPRTSPRLAAGLACPIMRTVCDGDYLTSGIRDKYRVYRDLYDEFDAYYACATRLISYDGFDVALAAFRSRRSGEFEPDQRAAFEALLPRVRAAFDLQLTLDADAVDLTLNAFQSMNLAAFVCDPRGRLVAASPAGEAQLRSGEFLTLRQGRLTATAPACEAALTRGLAIATTPATHDVPTSPILLFDRAGRRSRRLQMAPFPRDVGFAFGPAILIAMPQSQRGGVIDDLGRIGLSPAEARVAHAIAQGRSPSEIAVERGVSRETIRTQIKNIYAKLGVHSAAQLAARLAEGWL